MTSDRASLLRRKTAPLVDRLREWGHEQGKAQDGRPLGWGFSWGICEDEGAQYGKVTATLGPHTGYGRTTNEALKNLADGVIEDGWFDDRTETVVDAQCASCKADGKGTYLTDFRCRNCGLEGEMVHSLTHDKLDSAATRCPRCECRKVYAGEFIA